jgi:nucleotide-binding universal stress UspA family protein
MKRFKNILVYLPTGAGLDEALEHAFALARANGARVKLLGVVEPPPALVSRLLPGVSDVSGLIADHQRAVLADLASSTLAKGLFVCTRLRVGRAHEEIIREVVTAGHDLVIKSAQAEDSSGSIFGSTGLHLLRKCPCPVWIVKKGARRFRRIVAAVDPSVEEGEPWQLQRTLLELACSLSESQQAEVSVVHAWELPGETLLRNRMAPEDLEAAIAAQESAAHEALTRLAGSVDPPVTPERLTLIKGSHGPVLARHVETTGTDLLVLGTVSRSGIAGLFVGNTAERVLKDLRCSVLAVKPPGFATPVSLSPSGEGASAPVTAPSQRADAA